MLAPPGGWAGLLNGVKVGTDQWIGLEGWLMWSAHPLGGAVYRVYAWYPAFCSWHHRSGNWVLAFLYFIVHNLPQLHMHAVIFSPL